MGKSKGGTKAPREKYSIEQIEKALLAAGGFLSHAARLLGCSLNTLKTYIYDRYPDELVPILEDIDCAKLDVSEIMLMKKIRMGETSSIHFHLERKGKGRGYGKPNTRLNLNANVDGGKDGNYGEMVKEALEYAAGKTKKT